MTDLNVLKKNLDCVSICEKYGHELKFRSGQWEGSCPNCGGTDRFFIPDNNRSVWFCRECPHDPKYRMKFGSGLDLIMIFEKVDFKTARSLCIADNPAVNEFRSSGTQGTHGTQTYHKEIKPIEPPEVWQELVGDVVLESIDYLWSKEGIGKLTYLRNRGLTDSTIKNFKLGYNPRIRRIPCKGIGFCHRDEIVVPYGITIPTYVQFNQGDRLHLLSVKVRTEDPKRKYMFASSGVQPVLYCAKYAVKYPKIIFTEGEFDCMTVNQCCHSAGIRAVTFGSHDYCGELERWKAWYKQPIQSVICFDNDADPTTAEAVSRSAEKLRATIAEAQAEDPEEIRAHAPQVKHLPAEFHDWNDVLQRAGEATVLEIAQSMFE